MPGVSRYVRSHSGGNSNPILEAARTLHFTAGRPLARTTRPDAPSPVIEIDSDEERESSLLDPNLYKSTSKPAAMATNGPDTKVTKPTSNTRLRLKRKLNEYLKSSDTVEICVGPELTKWTLNEELLCDRIPYFKAAFKNGFKESKDKKLELPDDNPEVFGHLVEWLYMQQVACTVCEDFVNRSSRKEEENPNHVLPWARLWVLADKLGCEELMSWAEQKFTYCMGRVKFGVSPEVISFVFEKTRETSSLRISFARTFVHLFFQSSSYPDTFGEAAAANKTFNAEFLKQIKAHVSEKKEYCFIYGCTLHEADD